MNEFRKENDIIADSNSLSLCFRLMMITTTKLTQPLQVSLFLSINTLLNYYSLLKEITYYNYRETAFFEVSIHVHITHTSRFASLVTDGCGDTITGGHS